MEHFDSSLHFNAIHPKICSSCSSVDIPKILWGTLFRLSGSSISTLDVIAKKQYDCTFCQLFYSICVSALPADKLQDLHRSNAEIFIQQVPGRWERRLGLETGDVHSNSALLRLDYRTSQQLGLENIDNLLGGYSLTYCRTQDDIHPEDRQYRKEYELFFSGGQEKRINSEKRLRLLPEIEVKFPYVRFDLIRSWLKICEN